MSLFLVKDSSNDKIKQLECDSSGNLKVDLVDVSALATDAELSSIPFFFGYQSSRLRYLSISNIRFAGIR